MVPVPASHQLAGFRRAPRRLPLPALVAAGLLLTISAGFAGRSPASELPPWNGHPVMTDPGGLFPSPPLVIEGGLQNRYLGTRGGAAGDVNGDGYADVLLGGEWYGIGLHLGSPRGLLTTPAWTSNNSAAPAGDVNGDGYADLLCAETGRIDLRPGSPTGPSATPLPTALHGSCAAVGDINGDGFDDVVTGDKEYENGQFMEGVIQLYLGGPAGLAVTPAWTEEGNEANGYLGEHLASAGDVNGDGFGDFITTRGRSIVGTGHVSEAVLYLGGAGGPGASSPQELARTLGYDTVSGVAGAGDVNGDGFDDLLVSLAIWNAPPYPDHVHLFLGSPGGVVGAVSWQFTSPTSTKGPGYLTFGGPAGDVNGDGYADVMVSCPRDYYLPTALSRVRVYLGSPAGLSANPAWTMVSDQEGACLGTIATTAGDVDGDGRSDLLIGAPAYYRHEKNEGWAFVMLTRARSPEWRVDGPSPGARLGAAVAFAGDVNGDGVGDVLVGAPGYGSARKNEGEVRLFPGGIGGPPLQPAWSAAGGTPGLALGSAVCGAGDLDRDGFGDIAAGAPGSGYSPATAGEVRIWHGSPAGPVSEPGDRLVGPHRGSRFGGAVASAGDVNGDGFGDLLVGADLYRNGQAAEGGAFLYLGSGDGLAAAPAWRAESNQQGARLGYSVASAGDVNGDGYDDILVGAPWWFGSRPGQGLVQLYLGGPSGPGARPDWSLVGDQPDERLGQSVASAGDVNGDGFDDIVIGAPQYSDTGAQQGAVFVFPGSAAGLSRTPRWVLTGRTAHAYFGSAVASVPYDEEGACSDLLVGGYDYDGSGLAGGIISVFIGSTDGLSTAPRWTLKVDERIFDLDLSLATAGDVDGDRQPDVLVGLSGMDGNGLDAGMVGIFLSGAGGPLYSAVSGSRAPGAGAVLKPADGPAPAARSRIESVRPNPVLREAVIAYTLVEPGRVNVDVFDVQGRRLCRLIDEDQSKGAHAAVWTGEDASGESVAPGIYFVRLVAGGHAGAVKIVKVGTAAGGGRR